MNSDEEKLLKYCGCGLCCIGLLLMVILIPVSIKNVQHDEYAIRYDNLKNQIYTEVYVEGKYICTPQTTMFTYPRITKKLPLEFDCLSSDGIEMFVAVDILYSIAKESVFEIFDEFGKYDTLVTYLKLVAADSVRDSCGRYSAQNFYQQRAAIQSTIELDMQNTADKSQSHIDVSAVVLSNFEFPAGLDAAIKEKRAAENDIEIATNERAGSITEAETTLLKAEINAEKLQIEAQAEVDSILAEAQAKSAAIVEVWANRQSVYENIKKELNMTATEFVYQYLTSVILQVADSPITTLE